MDLDFEPDPFQYRLDASRSTAAVPRGKLHALGTLVPVRRSGSSVTAVAPPGLDSPERSASAEFVLLKEGVLADRVVLRDGLQHRLTVAQLTDAQRLSVLVRISDILRHRDCVPS